jgi:hypothetical protein
MGERVFLPADTATTVRHDHSRKQSVKCKEFVRFLDMLGAFVAPKPPDMMPLTGVLASEAPRHVR